MSCMNAVPSDASRCPNCGFNGKQTNEEGSLPIGFRLAGRYVVGMRKGHDGDSITYVGYDTTLNKSIEIREFCLHDGCERDEESMEIVANEGSELLYKTSLMDFSELYKNLRKVEGQPGMIRVPDFVEANNTAYAIVDLFDGITLREFLSMAGGTVSSEQALKLLMPVMNAVEAIHAVNLIHRGISPETIFVNRNGDVKLGGYATSQIRTRGTEVETKLYSGYAAPEQYSTTAWQSTSTDVYALAAVFYRCVTGITPQDAEQRRGYDTLQPLNKVKDDISPQLSRTVAVAMLIDAQQRTQLASDFLNALEQAIHNPISSSSVETVDQTAVMAPTGTKLQETEPEIDSEEQSRKKTRNRLIIYITSCVVAIVLLMAFVVAPLLGLTNRDKDNEDPDNDQNAVDILTVPNYLDKEYSALELDTENFRYEYDYVYEADKPVDTVIAQDPSPGVKVEKGSTITLTVNRGARVSMPNVVGDTLENAISKLTAAGITYNIVYEETDSYTPGVVIRQSIAEGTTVNPSTQQVTIVVAKAPPVVDPPPTDPGGEEGGENPSDP